MMRPRLITIFFRQILVYSFIGIFHPRRPLLLIQVTARGPEPSCQFLTQFRRQPYWRIRRKQAPETPIPQHAPGLQIITDPHDFVSITSCPHAIDYMLDRDEVVWIG
jgi:hypothetical protein